MNDLMKTSSPMYPMSDIEQMATIMAKSRMFGFRNIEEAISLMLLAQAEGMHPAKAAQRYHVIQGRPALKAESMLAGFQAAGGKIAVDEKTDTRVAVWFSHPTACPEPVLIDWTMDRAKKAGLTGKDTWNKYPRQMLYARVVSEGVRTCYPGVLDGMYTPEEVAEFSDTPMPASVTGTVIGSDVPHVTKSDAIADKIESKPSVETTSDGKKLFNGKELGNHFEVIARIAEAKTSKTAKTAVTKAYKKYAFSPSHRKEIDNALAIHCGNLDSLSAQG